jgi:hypothetical protein
MSILYDGGLWKRELESFAPQSPHVTPRDFWGYAKQVMYMVKINELDHLKQKTKRCS